MVRRRFRPQFYAFDHPLENLARGNRAIKGSRAERMPGLSDYTTDGVIDPHQYSEPIRLSEPKDRLFVPYAFLQRPNRIKRTSVHTSPASRASFDIDGSQVLL